MSEKPSSKDLAQLMADADALIQQMDGEFLENMNDAHRLAAEKHAQRLKEMKSAIEAHRENDEAADFGHGAKGMHEAIQEITKAMGELAKYLT